MKLTVLTENTANQRGMLAEHGLSVLAEANGRRILFDTGQTDVWLKNGRKLGLDPLAVDAIVFSHGHYDHCSGLEFAAPEKSLPPVYVGKGALEEKYCREKDGSLRKIGIPWQSRFKDRVNAIEKEGKTELFPGIFLVGGILLRTAYEGVPDLFVRKKEGLFCKDDMQDEQLLVIREKGKLHVLAGCCHMGVVSCLLQVKSLFPGEPFGVILAGMHLRGATQERIGATIEAIRRLDPECLIPVHCTGIPAIAQMKLAFGKKCRLAEAGKVFGPDIF